MSGLINLLAGFVIFLIFLAGCKKEDEHNYAEDFIGIYTTQIEAHSSTFNTQVAMVDNKTISIRSKWGGKEETYKATIDKYKLSIPEQYFDKINGETLYFSATGQLYNKNTLTIKYTISVTNGNKFGETHIGSK